jgi:hypothetical protein
MTEEEKKENFNYLAASVFDIAVSLLSTENLEFLADENGGCIESDEDDAFYECVQEELYLRNLAEKKQPARKKVVFGTVEEMIP